MHHDERYVQTTHSISRESHHTSSSSGFVEGDRAEYESLPDVSDTRHRMADRKADVSDTRHRMADRKADVSDTRQRMADRKADVSDTRQRMADRKADVGDASLDSNLAFDSFIETERRSKSGFGIERKFLKCCRLLIYLLTFGLVVTCGVINKLSVLKIVSDFSKSSGDDKLTNAVYLLVLICIYPTLTLLSSVFKVLFGHSLSVSKAIIIIAVVIDVVNTVGILLLLYAVLPHLDAMTSLVVMAFLPIVPSILCLLRSVKCAHGKFKTRVVTILFYFVIFSVQVGCFIWLFTTDLFGQPSVMPLVFTALPAVFLISISWWENFIDFKLPAYLQQSARDTTLSAELQRGRTLLNLYTSLSRLVTIGVCVLLFYYKQLPGTLNVSMFDSNSNLQNISQTIVSPSKNTPPTTLTPSNITCSFNTTLNNTLDSNTTDICGNQSTTATITSAQSLNEQIYDFVESHYIVLLIIGLTFLVSYCATLACKLHMQRLSFSLATLLISPLTFLYVCLRCSQLLPKEILIFETTNMCPSWNVVPTEGIALFAAAWFSTVLLTYYIWIPKAERMAKVDSMFVTPLKDCILLDYNLLLRRRNDCKTTTVVPNTGQKLIPKLYVCATMWHESQKEMFQLLKSLLRLDRHCALSRTAERKIGQIETTDPDKFDPEIHVVIDDAFDTDSHTYQEKPNMYVSQFIECMDEAATSILGSERKSEWTDVPVLSVMPYGARINRVLPGGTTMVIHLKNKNKIRHRKRWSQVMYLYYLLGFKSFNYKDKSSVLRNKLAGGMSFTHRLSSTDKSKLENTFILTLDGDVDFKPSSVIRLLDRMKKNVQVGAVCGRIHPIGSGPVVWYQKFEYAIGHWLQKAAEHVLGCVLCCPGCFSLFRASALVDNNVMKTYTRKPKEAMDYIQFEQGEDRWLCTLLLQQGYKIDYCAGADAKTFSPESFNDFFIQRRRWSPSTIANIVDLIMSWKHTVDQNADISRLFIAYEALMLFTSLIAPATVTMVIAGSFSMVLDVGDWISFLLAVGPIVVYVWVCMTLPDNVQLFVASLLSALFTVVMVTVTVGTVISIVSEDTLSPTVLFLAGLAAIFVLAGFWHPREIGCLFHGILYYVAVPSTFIFLTVYFICNIHVVKWGTRENASLAKRKLKAKWSISGMIKSFIQTVKDKLVGTAASSPNDAANPKELPPDYPSDSEESGIFSLAKRRNSQLSMEDWTCKEPFKKYGHDTQTPREEATFWKKVLRKYLEPVDKDNVHEQKMKQDLLKLRNNVVFGFFMLNLMLAVVLLQLHINREKLTGFYLFGKYEPVSVMVLTIFALLLLLQFFSMIVHRWSTFQHLISSTSLFTCSDLSESEKFKINYQAAMRSVNDDPPPDYDNDDDDEEHAGFNHGGEEFSGYRVHHRQRDRRYQRRYQTRSARNTRSSRTQDERSQNVYETRVMRNIHRTVRNEYNREHRHRHLRLPVPTYGRSKHRYLSRLMNKYYREYDIHPV